MERGDELTEEDSGETAGFDCNICFGLAKDPVITLCGHLHCWPCLYEWLRFHSQSHECPVCKALIRDDEELIHLNGRHQRVVPRRPATAHGRRSSGFVPRVRFREFSGYGSAGEGGVVEDDNMNKILFFILLFVVFDFLLI